MEHQATVSSTDEADHVDAADSSMIQIHKIVTVSSGDEEQIRSRIHSRYHGNTDSGEESPYEFRRSDRIPPRTHCVEDHGSHYVIKQRESTDENPSVHVIGSHGNQEIEYSTIADESEEIATLMVYDNQLSQACQDSEPFASGDNQVIQVYNQENPIGDDTVEYSQEPVSNSTDDVQEQERAYTISAAPGVKNNTIQANTNTSSTVASSLLKQLPTLEIVDESGNVSTVSDLPPGSQIVLDPQYKGLADLTSGSRIILNTNADQVPHVEQESHSRHLGMMTEENPQHLLAKAQESQHIPECSAFEHVEQLTPQTDTVGAVQEHPPVYSEEISSLPPTEKNLPSNVMSTEQLSNNSSEAEGPKDESRPDHMDNSCADGESREGKRNWKWFRDSVGGRPSKFTCKVYDAVFATISLDLLHSLQSAMSLGEFPDNCALLEHLLVTKHHVTDLMIREDETELQLAGDLIDIMEVHNVLLGNVNDREKCQHKPLQPCSAVVRDVGIMCNGVPQTTGRSGRKLKKIYTKDMYTRVPVGLLRDQPSDQEQSATSDQEGRFTSSRRLIDFQAREDEINGRRKSNRVSKPPVKMEDSVSPPKKKRGRKPYRRTKVTSDVTKESQVEVFSEKEQTVGEQDANVVIAACESAEKTPAIIIAPEQEENNQESSMQEQNDQTDVEPEVMQTDSSEGVNLVYLEVQASSKPPGETELQSDTDAATTACLGELDPIVEQPEMMNGLDMLNAIKEESRNNLSLDVDPMTTQTVDSFLPIITGQDGQSEDENLLATHDHTMDVSAASLQPSTSVDQIVNSVQEPLPLQRQNYKPKPKKKDYEALTPFKYFCTKCSFKTKREGHFHKHSLLHSEKNLPILRCSRCDYSTLTLSRLRHHEVSHTTNALTCVVCSYKTISLQQLRKHHLKNHEIRSANLTMPTEMKCDHCTYKTDKMHLFQRHQQCHAHVSGNKSGVRGMMIPTYSCTHCSYGTRKKESFIRHMENVHSDVRPYLCDVCGAGFKRKDTLKTHRLVHLDKGQRTFKYYCPQCNKGLRSKGHLDEHLSMHSNKRQYLCEICGASFKTRGIQRRHIFTIHKNPKSYPCDTCKKNFNTKFALHRHHRTHELAQLRDKNSDLASGEVNMADTSHDTTISPPYMNIKPDDESATINTENLTGSNIVHIQPMPFSDQALAADQVITELRVLPVESSLENSAVSQGGSSEVAHIVQGLDADHQKVEVQLQPTLVQTSSGATTLFYLTTVPQDVTVPHNVT